jgi:hypothetical protein
VTVEKVISGGQTGVDRAALDAALELDIPIGGWLPKGRRTEEGPLDAKYPLLEMETTDYPSRTRQNIIDSDATLILALGGRLKGGTKLTRDLCQQLDKPHAVFNLRKGPSAQAVPDWLRSTGVKVLNVAGPRQSKCPGIYDTARAFLLEVLGEAEEPS